MTPEEREDFKNRMFPTKPVSKKDFSSLNREQKEALRRQESQFGKVVSSEDKPNPIEQASEQILSQNHFVTIEETKDILYYKDGVYLNGGEVVIEKAVERIYGYEFNNGQISEIKGHIRRKTYHKREEFDANINIINLSNGLYNIEKNELTSHRPDYLSLNQKPIVYSKNARPKLFGKFLKEVLYSHDITTALDAMAYTFHRDYELEYIFMLFGLGANGKSVFTNVLSSLHGRRNISNVTLSQMQGDRFALADLENRDINIDNEVKGYLGETATLKRITSGSKQPVRIQRKNKEPYDAVLYAKLFFNANRMPEIQDITDADSRRLVVIAFPNTFENSKADTKLIPKLTTQEELSGIFNVLMVHLRYIILKQKIHINEKTIQERRQKYERSVDSARSFINEAVSEESKESDYVTKLDFFDSYTEYCKEHSLPTEKYDTFCKRVKKLKHPEEIDFDIRDSRTTIDKEKISIWKGITIKPKKKGMNPLLEDLR